MGRMWEAEEWSECDIKNQGGGGYEWRNIKEDLKERSHEILRAFLRFYHTVQWRFQVTNPAGAFVFKLFCFAHGSIDFLASWSRTICLAKRKVFLCDLCIIWASFVKSEPQGTVVAFYNTQKHVHVYFQPLTCTTVLAALQLHDCLPGPTSQDA
jgi:hypothetical protein